jgi:hypothetical protein
LTCPGFLLDVSLERETRWKARPRRQPGVDWASSWLRGTAARAGCQIGGCHMPLLNRSLLTVRPRRPFLDWYLSQDDAEDVTLEDLREEPTGYLLSEYELEEDRDAVLQHFWDLVFEHELMAWVDNEKAWPRERTFPMFRDWFDVELSSLVIDIVDAPLLSDEG